MKVFSILLAVMAARVMAQEAAPFSAELLQTLGAFSSSDPIIASLISAIEDSSKILDAPAILSTISVKKARQDSSRSQVACQMLRSILPNNYADPKTNTSGYNALRDNNWSTNCQLPAACFLTPEHPAQVAVSLQVIARLQARFAVQSGGHNPNPGFAGVGPDGITISLQRFQSLSLSADKATATVGAGLRFGPVQAFLDSQGVAVVSGRNRYVGVSGLLLGGGHPIVNSLTGLAADNIKSMEVVLSDFRVVTASRTENPDLFRALKGGGNNFGIVTKFELYTTMPRNIWYRSALYGASDPAGILGAFAQVQLNMEADPKAGIQMTCTPAGFTVTFVYSEYTSQPAVFAPFDRFVPISESTTATNGTTLQFIELQSPPQPKASRDTVAATTITDAALYLEIYNQYRAVAAANNNTSAAFLLPIQTFGASAARIADQNGGNVLGTSQRAQTWWNPIAQWTDPADDAQVHGALLQLADYIRAASQARGAYDPFLFLNIAAREQNVLASYGQGNLDFLRLVSRTYDRAGMFQYLQNGGFLVSRA